MTLATASILAAIVVAGLIALIVIGAIAIVLRKEHWRRISITTRVDRNGEDGGS